METEKFKRLQLRSMYGLPCWKQRFLSPGKAKNVVAHVIRQNNAPAIMGEKLGIIATKDPSKRQIKKVVIAHELGHLYNNSDMKRYEKNPVTAQLKREIDTNKFIKKIDPALYQQNIKYLSYPIQNQIAKIRASRPIRVAMKKVRERNDTKTN